MSTDRELLEMAAKVAGAEYFAGGEDWDNPRPAEETEFYMLNGEFWNLMEDDGDALRLAVARRYTVMIASHEIEVFNEDECLVSIPMQEHEDYNAATRRAITMAAAEEGRRMP